MKRIRKILPKTKNELTKDVKLPIKGKNELNLIKNPVNDGIEVEDNNNKINSIKVSVKNISSRMHIFISSDKLPIYGFQLKLGGVKFNIDNSKILNGNNIKSIKSDTILYDKKKNSINDFIIKYGQDGLVVGFSKSLSPIYNGECVVDSRHIKTSNKNIEIYNLKFVDKMGEFYTEIDLIDDNHGIPINNNVVSSRE